MAAMVSSGALRFGQCPVASISTSRLPASRSWTYSPTACGAIASSAHCRTSAGRAHPLEVGAVVGEEGGAGEVRGDLGVGAAEAVRELLAQLGAVVVAHDHRRHRARPAEVVALQRLEQALDVLAVEAADVAVVVEVAGGGADEDEPGEALGLLGGGERADHRADGVPDEDDVASARAPRRSRGRPSRSRRAWRSGRGRTRRRRSRRCRRGRRARSGGPRRTPARRGATCSGRSRSRGRTASGGRRGGRGR